MAPSNSKTVTKAPAAKKSTESEEPKEIIRDEIFSRFDRPLGLMDQHIFNIITLAASHIFAVYTILFVPIPWKAFVFFGTQNIFYLFYCNFKNEISNNYFNIQGINDILRHIFLMFNLKLCPTGIWEALGLRWGLIDTGPIKRSRLTFRYKLL